MRIMVRIKAEEGRARFWVYRAEENQNEYKLSGELKVHGEKADWVVEELKDMLSICGEQLLR
jgi:hypothetical protein